MADREKEAFWEGRKDHESYDRQDSASQFLNNVLGSNYDPPEGHEEAYRAGWDSKDED